ncbi:hypothetical protein BJ968_004717 [Kineococcus aurantiacus]|uniref:Uncharacterized protein n=1 Tax=Kineococcus aurantiacus TaxID=37633 RepID=A0A7Y9DR18_9ACTN|nr:hypothetical protein [Kineococcus aurantiacus]
MGVLAFSAPLSTAAGFISVLLTYSGNTGPAIHLLQTLFCILISVASSRWDGR